MKRPELKFSSKTILEMAVLTVLSKDGFRATEILSISKNAGLDIKLGTLYPLLAELTRANFISRHIEELDFGYPTLYNITAKGQNRLAHLNSMWNKLNNSLTSLQKNRSIL